MGHRKPLKDKTQAHLAMPDSQAAGRVQRTFATKGFDMNRQSADRPPAMVRANPAPSGMGSPQPPVANPGNKVMPPSTNSVVPVT